jgi:hypothetical protein
MSDISRQARGRRNQFFDAQGVDELISMVLELGAEVSALRERMFLLERVLESRNIEVSEAIEDYRPDAAEQAALAQQRERLLAAMLRNLQAPRGAERSATETAAELQGDPAADSAGRAA